MRTLKFVVEGQSIKKKSDCDFSGLVSGSENYLKAKFLFSVEWHGCKKAASFWLGSGETAKEYAVLLDDFDSCMIPSEVLTAEQFKVSVTGVKKLYKITTNQTKVRQEVY